MWIADYQTSSKNNAGDLIEGSPQLRSILLRKGNLYTIGRQANSDICVDHPKVSRSQVEIRINFDGNLEIKNKGHASLSCGKSIIDGKQEKPYIITTSTVVKIKAANDWRIVFRNVEDIVVSKYVHEKISSILNLDFSIELNDNEIMIGNIKTLIDNVEVWIDTLSNREWEKFGGLAKIIVPKSVKGELKITKKDNLMEKMVEVTPISQDSQYSLIHRTSKRTRKSQLQSVFDDLENLDDLSPLPSTKNTQNYTFASQNTMRSKKSQLTQFFDDMDESEPILLTKGLHKETIGVKDRSSNNNLDDATKDRDLQMENVSETMNNLSIKRPIEISPGYPAKKFKSSKPKEALIDVFKKTKQMKIDRLEKEEELIDSMKTNNEMAKVSKFKVVRAAVNPRVYSAHNIIYNNDPKWENRLNYSKFSKINSNIHYNPILDSTIKTVKFKSSNYKSNERQINLYQNDDMIPDLDTMFESRHRQSHIIARNITTGNHEREPTLFVDSDYEDTQYNTSESLGYSNNRLSKISDTQKRKYGVSNTTGSATTLPHALDDDETPVFRSRRR